MLHFQPSFTAAKVCCDYSSDTQQAHVPAASRQPPAGAVCDGHHKTRSAYVSTTQPPTRPMISIRGSITDQLTKPAGPNWNAGVVQKCEAFHDYRRLPVHASLPRTQHPACSFISKAFLIALSH
ncbi:hypothetical protein E2C01_014761 [Portunus trituberculatus]|uniref:Uncharacterized protein n=1 Tax=Portunus trituberculatus TaxID=210409 RepID=A0A5B7DKZ0_PORTR|nr:hypothetical protein [Portunus trituberculatus]